MCGNLFLADAVFCQKCGAKRLDPEMEPPPKQEDLACVCGCALPRDARFCPNCGKNQLEASLELEALKGVGEFKKEKENDFMGQSGLIKGQRSDETHKREPRSVTPRRSEPPQRSDRRSSTPRRSDPPQRRTSGVKDVETAFATGKVAAASKLAHRNGSELSADVQSYAELSADAAASCPDVGRKFRKYANVVVAANRFGAASRGGGKRESRGSRESRESGTSKTSDKIFAVKATLPNDGRESEGEGASSARDFTEPEAE